LTSEANDYFGRIGGISAKWNERVSFQVNGPQWLRGAAVLLATHALDIVEHYASRAGLLLDGRLKREWRKHEIQELRTGGKGFDAALAEAAAQ
jgi:hypothetical protein